MAPRGYFVSTYVYTCIYTRTMAPTDVTSSQLPLLNDVNGGQDDVTYTRYSLTTPISYACANDVIINDVIALGFIAVIVNHG